MELTDLKKGDIFKFGKETWDVEHRFHSMEKQKDGRYFILLMSVGYLGNSKVAKSNSFTWRDDNVNIFIPVFYKCEFKKSKGVPCVPVNNHRCFYPQKLNSINISELFCNRNDYWYEYAQIL